MDSARDELDEPGEDTLPPIERCFLFEGERVVFTKVGIDLYRERFGRAGIDIRKIKTRAQLHAALEASFPAHWQRLVGAIAAKKPKSHREGIERALLVAIALGDKEQAAQMQAAVERLNAHRLAAVRAE